MCGAMSASRDRTPRRVLYGGGEGPERSAGNIRQKGEEEEEEKEEGEEGEEGEDEDDDEEEDAEEEEGVEQSTRGLENVSKDVLRIHFPTAALPAGPRTPR
jgi:hypothetical protein